MEEYDLEDPSRLFDRILCGGYPDPLIHPINKRVVKSPKIYFTDTGLLIYILRYPDRATLAAGPANGAVFENFVIMEFLKQKAARSSMKEFFFYRDNNQSEIDFIIDFGFRQELFEIKLSKTPQKKHISQLHNFKDLFATPSLYLISTFENIIKLSDDVSNLPFFRIPDLADF